jgi:aspartyl-tRNA(Asn)/glutamyl-tRNA(Gln) amidotransferase subunit C
MIPTQDEVRHIAQLARLHLTPEENELYRNQLTDIFTLFDKLNEVDVSSVQSAHHASREHMELRPDVVSMPDSAEKILHTTHQEVINGHIAIPAIMRKK